MHKYEVQFKFNTDSNGGCTSKTAQISLNKRYFAFTDAYGNDGKGNNEILLKAVEELGLNPNMVDAISDKSKLDGGWYKLTYLGQEGNEKKNKKEKTKPTKSIFNPLWAFPFKLIWRIIKGVLFFWL
jgi:hypothetical protein